MNLIWFLTIGVLISLILGEFGQYPFAATTSISLTDLLLGITLIFLLIWKIGIKKDLFLPKPFLFLVGFWGIGFLSLIINSNFSGVFYLFRFILYSSSFLIGFFLILDKVTDVNQISKIVAILGVTISFLGFIQLLIFPDLQVLTVLGYDPHLNRLVSTFLDPNFTGTFLNICLMNALYLFFVTKNKNWIFISLLILLGVIFTYSRSAYLMLLVEILVLGVLRYRKLLIISLVIGVLTIVLVPRVSERIIGGFSIDKSSSERIESWQKGVIVFQMHPIFGVGFNNLREAFTKEDLLKLGSGDGGNSGAGIDSSILFILATAGVLGLLGWLGFLSVVFKKVFLLRKKQEILFLTTIAIFLGLLVNSQFINSLFYPQIMFLTYLMLGVLYALSD